MAVAGCPDYFLLHPNYQGRLGTGKLDLGQGCLGKQQRVALETVDRTPAHRPAEQLIGPGFQCTAKRNSTQHQDDDVDLEELVNEMNTSAENAFSAAGLRPDTQHAQALQPGGRSHAQRPAILSPGRGGPPPSQPMHIQAVRRLQGEHQVRPSSLPAIPNPFPELCSPSGSPILSPIQISDNHTAASSRLWRATVWTTTAGPWWSTTRCWASLVVQVQASMGSEGKFIFRKNFAKYEFFRNPLNFFPEQMVAWCQESNGSIPPSQLLQNFLSTSSCPEVQGYLYMKETGRKSWKKLYMFLRRSGLYCSTKGTSKEPRHLQLLADLEENNVFVGAAARKVHNSPTDHQFSIKPSKARSECKELRMLCAEDEQSRTCWTTAFRLLKHGISLYHNFKGPQSRKSPLSHFSASMRSVSENSLVAMDFSGRTGRVIDNPAEKRSQRLNVLGSPGPPHTPSLSAVIHRTQLWFHGRIVREEAQRMIVQQGQVDGLFLLRDSQSNPKAFVLTLSHHQKTKHFQILPYEEEGQVLFSLDDGATKFTDLIHLVDFYELNRGVLPCRLKHPCTAVAL
ncbi:hypothetical protein NHX12_023643 [Muraenolepis orangiensis]|uniref:Growth factor receptor bound protein 10 n=1 Tax=Muraenolepis orangiensis TaxID=630683 RepID=A0A9Q0IQ73_9TELE|nr:hypothetical protein NHX12_023643 [Muraenolepis orangiensis]